MRLKSVPFWEQYLEKIILGLLLVALMAVLVLQFASNPNIVDVRVNGQSRDLTPGQINEALIENGEKILSAQRPDSPPMETPPNRDAVRMVAGDLKRMTSGGVVSGDLLPRTAPIMASAIMPTEIRSDLLFNNPEPLKAVVMMDRVESFSDELTDLAIEEYPELESYVASDENREIDWLVPVGEIDMRSIRSQFNDSDAEHNAIPAYWRDETYAIVDVVFERQTMGSDGSWSSSVEVVPPGILQLSFREDLATYQGLSGSARGEEANEQRLALRETLLSDLYKPARQTEILQPGFFDTEWGSVDRFLLDPRNQSNGNQSAAAIDLETKYLRQRTKVERARSELDKIGGPLEEDDSRRASNDDDRDRGSGRGGRGGGRGGGAPPGGGGTLGGGSKTAGSGDDRNSADADAERTKKLRINKTRQLRMLEKQLATLLERLEEEVPQSDLLGGGGTQIDSTLVNLEQDMLVLTWIHDLDVEQGNTYRYRCVAKFYNPFFTRSFQLNDSQKVLGARPVLVTKTSDWSGPVTLDSGTQFFVTDAQPASGKELGEANIVVFSKDDGRYWSESYTVKPGDRIGGTKRRSGSNLDFNTDWYVVDIIRTGSSDQDGSSGGAEVIVQKIGALDEIDYRNVSADASSPDMIRLDSLVRNAEERSKGLTESGSGDNNPPRGGPGGGRGDGGRN